MSAIVMFLFVSLVADTVEFSKSGASMVSLGVTNYIAKELR